MALRTTSQSLPQLLMGTFCCCMMSSSCARTSFAFRSPVAKCWERIRTQLCTGHADGVLAWLASHNSLSVCHSVHALKLPN